jgi:hypothetical protein
MAHGGGSNSALDLRRAGQSIWLDYLGHDILARGNLERLIE